MITGAYTEPRIVDEAVKEIAIKMKDAIEKKVEVIFNNYHPETYQTQVIDGTIYKIVISVDAAMKVTAEIFRNLSGGYELFDAKLTKPEP